MRNTIKMRTKLFFIPLAFLVINISQSYSQTVVTLNQPETGIKDHKANYNVEFQVGYHYGANATDNLHGYIDEAVTGNSPTGSMYSGGFGGTFDSRAINTNLTVGAIEGTHSVTPTGGASYSIPIKLAPGKGGEAPSLAINYSSQSSNGLLGMGWHLGGVSVITRAPKTFYHDGGISPIIMDNTSGSASDAFSLDGERLIVTNGNYGANGSIYATEKESFNKITSNGSIGNSPSWFKVESKNGRTFEYGNSSSSKYFPNQNRSSVVSWYLNKVTDINGNYYTYHYRIENDEILLDEIQYGGNNGAGIQAYNNVQFIYNERQDKNSFDIADEPIKQNVVLSQIKVRSEGTLVRKYEFKYGFDIYTYLTEVTEYGSDNSPLNSTIFKYGDAVISASEENVTLSELTPSVGDGYEQEFWTGDYNGDGKMDLISFSFGIINVPGQGADKVWQSMDLFINDGNNQYTKSGPYTLPAGFQGSESVYPKPKGQIGNSSLQVVDFNGDGLSDVLFIIPDGSDNFTFYPYISSGTSLVAQSSFTINTEGSFLTRTYDADGDGKTEIFVTYSTGPTTFNYELIFNLNRSDPKSCSTNYNAVFQQVPVAYNPPQPEPVGQYAPLNCVVIDYFNHPTTGIPTPIWDCDDNPLYIQAMSDWFNSYVMGNVSITFGNGQFLGLKYDFSESYVYDQDGDGKYSLENVIETPLSADRKELIFDYDGSSFYYRT